MLTPEFSVLFKTFDIRKKNTAFLHACKMLGKRDFYFKSYERKHSETSWRVITFGSDSDDLDQISIFNDLDSVFHF